MKKLWLKQDPAVTAEIIKELNGVVAAQLHNPHEEIADYLGFIDLNEWSTTELIPTPACCEPKIWVAVLGQQDPTEVTYVTFANEVALHVAIATRSDILGYFEVHVPDSMSPAKIKP